MVSSKVMKENDYDHNKIDVLFESIKNIDSQLSSISEQLRILSENNQIQKRVEIENEIVEFSYTDFLRCDSKNFYKQTIYIYLPLYEICKDILKGKSRLIYEFFNQSFFKVILEDYIKKEKEKNINFVFNKEEFNQYLLELIEQHKI